MFINLFSDWNLYSTGFRIGDSAKDLFHSNPKNTVFDVKRLIGCTMEEVKRDLKHLPFTVKEKNGAPVISVTYENKIREFVCSILPIFICHHSDHSSSLLNRHLRKSVP